MPEPLQHQSDSESSRRVKPVEALEAVVRKGVEKGRALTQKGKEWVSGLRIRAPVAPREVLEAEAQASALEPELGGRVDAPMPEKKDGETSLITSPTVIDEKYSANAAAPNAEVNPVITDSKPIEHLVERPIIIPPNLKVISGPNAGQAGTVYIDRVNRRAYRKVDLERYPEDAEFTRRDFLHKIEVAKRDSTGITPKVYAYDTESMTMEMELIDGQDFTREVTVSVAEARKFIATLDEFHKQGLFHGDMYPREHWFKTPDGNIRLIDPIYMPVDIPDSGTTVEKIQAMDRAMALARLQEFGVSEANIYGQFFEVREQTKGQIITGVDETLEEGIKDKNIQFVYQRGIGFSDGNDPKARFIETSDFGSEKPMFGSCIVLVARSSETKKTVVLHADKQTDLQAARAQMSHFFGKERVNLAVIGGQSDNSEGILNDINATFTQEPGWKLNQLDILGEKFMKVRQVIVDVETGALYDLQGASRRNMKPWSYDYPPEIKVRAAKAAMIEKSLQIDIPLPPSTI